LNISGCENDAICAVKVGFGGEFFDGENLYGDDTAKTAKQYFLYKKHLLIIINQHKPRKIF
jgi:hypothetical protein